MRVEQASSTRDGALRPRRALAFAYPAYLILSFFKVDVPRYQSRLVLSALSGGSLAVSCGLVVRAEGERSEHRRNTIALGLA